MLEITEGLLLEVVRPRDRTTLQSIRQLGFKIALDDFGTGYSSLTLSAAIFHFDKLKIDRSFVTGISPKAENTAHDRPVGRQPRPRRSGWKWSRRVSRPRPSSP